jgi:hypothetical protein
MVDIKACVASPYCETKHKNINKHKRLLLDQSKMELEMEINTTEF